MSQTAKFLERQLPVSLQEAGDFGVKRGCHFTPLNRADVGVCERSVAREQGDLAVSCSTQSGHRGPSKYNHKLCLCVRVCICVTKVCVCLNRK